MNQGDVAAAREAAIRNDVGKAPMCCMCGADLTLATDRVELTQVDQRSFGRGRHPTFMFDKWKCVADYAAGSC